MIYLNNKDLDKFKILLDKHLGINFEVAIYDHLTEIVQDRMKDLNLDDINAYLARFQSAGPRRFELRFLAERLTVNETYFFRHGDQLRAFSEVALPESIARKEQTHRLGVLSAGCASGEEIYTLAQLIHPILGRMSDLNPWVNPWELELIGVDINPASIEKARRGCYSEWSLRETSALAVSQMFQKQGREFHLKDSLRQSVQFQEMNLLDENPEFWQPGRFDIIFCRNVLMYFSLDSAREVVNRLTSSLAPGGFLFLSPSETLRGLSNRFHLRHSHSAFYYQSKSPHSSGQIFSSQIPWNNQVPRVTQLSEGEFPSWQTHRKDDQLPLSGGDGSLVSQEEDWVSVITRSLERVKVLEEKLTPQSSAPSVSRDSPEKIYQIAHQYFEEEKFEDAIRELEALSEETNANPDVLVLRAILLTNQGKVQEAEQICAQILEVDELNAGAYYLKALFREHHGDRQAAIEDDRTAIYLDQKFAMPHLHLAMMSRREGDLKTAKSEFAQAIQFLESEDVSKILLFGGGFSRKTLIDFCRAEMRHCEGVGEQK